MKKIEKVFSLYFKYNTFFYSKILLFLCFVSILIKTKSASELNYGILCGVMVSELDKQTFINDSNFHWVPHYLWLCNLLS